MSTVSRRGFTLIELSIVLVVIALLVGSIFVGQDLIHAAQLRSVMRQIEVYDTAANTFKAKYNCLPGDCSTAANFGFADAGCPAQYECVVNSAGYEYAGCNGNGNGALDEFDGPYTEVYGACPENLNFWNHLSRAGFIEGAYDGKSLSLTISIAADPSTPVFGVSAPLTRLRDVGMFTNFGDTYVIGERYVFPSVRQLYVSESYWLDLKMDDGGPLTGRVKCTGGVCFETPASTNRYNLQVNPPTYKTSITVKMPLYRSYYGD